MFMHVLVRGCFVRVSQYLKGPEEAVGSPSPALSCITGSREPSDMGAGDWTEVNCKSSVHFRPPSHLSSPSKNNEETQCMSCFDIDCHFKAQNVIIPLSDICYLVERIASFKLIWT